MYKHTASSTHLLYLQHKNHVQKKGVHQTGYIFSDNSYPVTYNMNKAKVTYLQNDSGDRPALDTIFAMAQKANAGDKLCVRLLPLIRLGLRDIEKHGIPDWDAFQDYQFVTTESHGFLVTLNVVRRLDHSPPLLELRVHEDHFPTDRQKDGYAFRMLFFTHYHNGTQYICCTESMIMKLKSNIAFSKMVMQSLQMHADFIRNPVKYIGR